MKYIMTMAGKKKIRLYVKDHDTEREITTERSNEAETINK